MAYSYIDEAKTIVADTYLAYTSDIDGPEAFNRFVSKSIPHNDVRRDPRFFAFTDEELIDEMILMKHDIINFFERHLHMLKNVGSERCPCRYRREGSMKKL